MMLLVLMFVKAVMGSSMVEVAVSPRTRPKSSLMVSTDILKTLAETRGCDVEAMNALTRTVFGASRMENIDRIVEFEIDEWNQIRFNLLKQCAASPSTAVLERAEEIKLRQFIDAILDGGRIVVGEEYLAEDADRLIQLALSSSATRFDTNSVYRVYSERLSMFMDPLFDELWVIARALKKTPRFIIAESSDIEEVFRNLNLYVIDSDVRKLAVKFSPHAALFSEFDEEVLVSKSESSVKILKNIVERWSIELMSAVKGEETWITLLGNLQSRTSIKSWLDAALDFYEHVEQFGETIMMFRQHIRNQLLVSVESIVDLHALGEYMQPLYNGSVSHIHEYRGSCDEDRQTLADVQLVAIFINQIYNSLQIPEGMNE